MIKRLPNLKPIHRNGHYTIYKRSIRRFKNAAFELYYQFDLVMRFPTEREALAAIPLHKEWIQLRSEASSIETHERNMQQFPELWKSWTGIGYIPDWLRGLEADYRQWLRSHKLGIMRVTDFDMWMRSYPSIEPLRKTKSAPKAEWNSADKFYARGMGIKWEDENL